MELAELIASPKNHPSQLESSVSAAVGSLVASPWVTQPAVIRPSQPSSTLPRENIIGAGSAASQPDIFYVTFHSASIVCRETPAGHSDQQQIERRPSCEY